MGGVDERTLVRSSRLLAELILTHDRERRRRTELSICYSDAEKIQYLDLDSQDETPMSVGRRDDDVLERGKWRWRITCGW